MKKNLKLFLRSMIWIATFGYVVLDDLNTVQ